MTSLTSVLRILRPHCDPMVAIQVSPRNIFLTVSEEHFWTGLESLGENKTNLKFMERRQQGLNIHLSIEMQKSRISISFRVINPSKEFIEKLGEKFPSSVVYIKELENLPFYQ